MMILKIRTWFISWFRKEIACKNNSFKSCGSVHSEKNSDCILSGLNAFRDCYSAVVDFGKTVNF